MKEKILVVDDEKDIVKMLTYNLQKEGYRTVAAYDGDDALYLAGREHPDLVILDLMLPGMDGLEVCKTLKKDPKLSSVPIIMLTAKTQESDKVVGLELGADDYVSKPFSVKELLARVKAVLRRTKEKDQAPHLHEAGGLRIDFDRIAVTVNGKQVELTSKEFELLKTLIGAKGRVLSRDYLLDTIWGFDNAQDIQTRTVDVHIRTLRKKLKSEAKNIVTVKNYGYRFENET
jgi:two-component system, OmpR family, alkaline phosphatase synthesis response regulator PhoP